MKTRNVRWRYGSTAAIIGVLVAALGIGCSAPNTANQTAVIDVFSVSPTTLQQGETAIVEIRLTNSRGDPLEGVTVTLAADPASGGSFDKQTLTTGADGTAVTVFTATTTGTVTLEASAENAVAQYVTVTIESSQAAGSMTITVNPGIMAADAISQAVVSCRVYDGNGEAVPDGTQIRLAAGEKFVDVDKSGYFTVGLDNLVYDFDEDGEWDAIGEIESQVYTAGGLATANYTAGATATTVYIKVTAFLSAGVVQKDISLSLSASAGCLTLEIEPRRIRADGASQAQVIVRVCDGTGQPARDSSMVKLAAGEKFLDGDKSGYFTGCCTDSVLTDYDGDELWDAIGLIDSVVYTIDGVAMTYYTAGTVAESVYIKATVGEGDGCLQIDKGILLLATDSIASINLAPERQRTQVRGTGGIEWTIITATAFDAYGNRAPQDLPIDFLITAGPGGGENINGDPEGPVMVLTDENGEATVTFNSGIISGTVRIRATAGNVVSAATQVAIVSGPPAHVSVGADDCNVPSCEVVNYQNPIVAIVSDTYNNECADSTAVYFGTEQGIIEGFDGTHIAFTERGLAVSVWKSGNPRDDGYVWYWAETEGGEVADTSFFFESCLPGTTTIVIYPSSLLADGKDKYRVLVEVVDLNGVFMDTDYPIELRTTYGFISSGGLGDGCHSSYYETELFSQTFDQDRSYTIPDDGIVGVSLVEAIAGGFYGAYDSRYVIFHSVPAFADNCNIDVETTIPHGYSVPVDVAIKDRYGNPLGGHKIVLTSQNGQIAGSPQYTDPWGVAYGFTYTTTSNFGIEIDFLTAEDQDPGYGGITLTQKITVKEDE